MKIVKAFGTPKARVLSLLKDGDFFGEMGVIEDSPRYANAIVEEESVILKVKKSDFDDLMAVNPAIAMKIMVTVTRRYKINAMAEEESAAQAPVAVEAPVEPERLAQCIVVHSPTGGAGVSTLVCNLGLEMQRLTGGKVLLVDGSTQFGDLSVLLDVIPRQTLYQLAEEEDFSPDMLREGYVNPTKFGIDFIASPLKPEQSEVVTADLFRVVVGTLKPYYDVIIFDTYSLMQEPILTLLEMADDIVYCMTPDLPSMKNARLWMELVGALDFTEADMKVVLMKVTGQSSVTAESIEKNLNTKVIGEVPYDHDLALECVNKGELIVQYRPKDPVSRGIQALAKRLCRGAEAKDLGSASFLRGWMDSLKNRFRV